jgi:predicted DNA-binding transcriptional regulator YafY
LARLPTGEVELEIPYNDPRELVGDLLRYGRHCEVVGPDELRRAVQAEVQAMAGIYEAGASGLRPRTPEPE